MKTFAILGDSYSTYKGWVPEDYAFWYKDGGNECENDMQSVEQTWWRIFAGEKGYELIANCSFSGSTVCNTGYDASDASTTSFIYRMKRELGEGQSSPDILIVFGGTNDFWAGSPVGEAKYSDWSMEELKAFGPAFGYMMDYLTRQHPHTVIYNVVNDEIGGSPSGEKIRAIMEEVCARYGVKNILLTDIAKENGHPNRSGMAAIGAQLAAAIL